MIIRFAMLLFFCCAAQASADKFNRLSADNFYSLTGNLMANNQLLLTYDIDKCCYLYKRSLSFNLLESKAAISKLTFPGAIRHNDEFFGDVEVYRGQVAITLELDLSQTEERVDGLKLKANQQGCSDEGICFLPDETILTFSFLPGLN